MPTTRNHQRQPSLSHNAPFFAKSSRRSSIIQRPSTASEAHISPPLPSPTAPVFVVSRNTGAESPTPAESPKQCRRRSFSNISNWAQEVQPGSPPPRSPLETSYPSTYNSNSSRRQATLSTFNQAHAMPHEATHSSPSAQEDARTGRFGSLNMFKSMKRSKSTAPTAKKPSCNKPLSRENIPPALMSELLLMQYTGGGSLETYIDRVLDAQAKKAAKAGQPSSTAGTGGMYRDERGQLWWDEADKVEYDSLLGDRRPSVTESFIDLDVPKKQRSHAKERKPSALHINTPSRQEFFEDSFVPQTAPIDGSRKQSRSRSNTRGIFGRR